MTLENFTYWGECGECHETMDESEDILCHYCNTWVCRKCIDEHEKMCIMETCIDCGQKTDKIAECEYCYGFICDDCWPNHSCDICD